MIEAIIEIRLNIPIDFLSEEELDEVQKALQSVEKFVMSTDISAQKEKNICKIFLKIFSMDTFIYDQINHYLNIKEYK